MVILYNFLPNLRSPESVGEIRKSVGAIRRVRREAEISRRFGAPQMAGRARRSDRCALGISLQASELRVHALGPFQVLESPLSQLG